MPIINKEVQLIGTLSDSLDGVSILHHRMYKNILKHLKGLELEILIRPLKRQRSEAQNRYMWGVVVPIVAQWYLEQEGMKLTKDQVYTFLRTRVLGQTPMVIVIDGMEMIHFTAKRFSQMNTKEFSDAVETILQYYADKGLEIPTPRKDNFIHDYFSKVQDT